MQWLFCVWLVFSPNLSPYLDARKSLIVKQSPYLTDLPTTCSTSACVRACARARVCIGFTLKVGQVGTLSDERSNTHYFPDKKCPQMS